MEETSQYPDAIWPYGRKTVLIDLPEGGYGRSIAAKLRQLGWSTITVSLDGEENGTKVAALITDRAESAAVVKWLMPETMTVLISDDDERPEAVDRVIRWGDSVMRPSIWGPLAYVW